MKSGIVIIGGGAAGLMAAIEIGRKGKKVLVLERKERILKKVLITGNGRCNITNVGADISNYFSMGKGIEGVKGILENFNPEKTIDFFYKLGIVCNEEGRGKVYPLSGQAASIVDSLRFEAERLGIQFLTDFYVRKIEKDGPEFKIYSEDRRTVTANRILLATGGKSYPELGSNGSGFELAKELGHKVTRLMPSIVQLKTEKSKVKGLQGIKLDTNVTAFGNGEKVCTYDGELLFTDYGVSGNVIFNISFVIPLYEKVELEIDFMPKFEYSELFEMLKKRKKILLHLTMENYFNGMINKKLGQFLCKMSGIEKLSKKIEDLSEKEIRKICQLLKKYRIEIVDTNGFKNAQVTAGGVALDEVNLETLESKKVKGLYFAGEILDVYGECGGYNLQWAWASGIRSGQAICE